MTGRSTVLKALLRERHLQEHRAFCREYDRAAKAIDRDLVGTYPSKATFYRWLAGDLRGLPYPDHCRVLERMLPGWTAAAMFADWTGESDGLRPDDRAADDPSADAAGVPSAATLRGLTTVFTSAPEFADQLPPETLFDDATTVFALGSSLDLLCRHYPRAKLAALLRRARVRLLFLDPAGATGSEPATRAAASIDVVQRLRLELNPASDRRVDVRLADEPLPCDLTLINNVMCVLQPALPPARGVDAPAFVMTRTDDDGNDLYAVFNQVFSAVWERARPI
jgi:Domain of unknown function (DUF5919)